MKLFFGTLLAAFVGLVLCRAPLSWDGGWILFTILDSRTPALYADRFVSVPLHSLVLAVGHATDNLRVLETTFSVIYAAMPVIGLALSWYVVRRVHRPLFIWAALGIGLGTLPGQFNFLSDGIMALNLFWPIYLSVLCQAPLSSLPVVAVLSLTVFFTHPVAAPLFAFSATVAALMSYRLPGVRRRMAVVAVVFGLLCIGKLALYFQARTTYDASEASLSMQLTHFRTAVAGLPLAALVCAWLAATALFVWPRVKSARWQARLRALQWTGVLAAGGLLVVWAAVPVRWGYALDFRNWALPSAFPFMAFAALEAVFPYAPRPEAATAAPWRQRLPIAQATAAIFLAVLGLQSVGWYRLSHRLEDVIASHRAGCSTLEELGWPAWTALDHWATPAYAVLLQGRDADALILYRHSCATGSFAQAMRFDHFFHVVNRAGWFNLPR